MLSMVSSSSTALSVLSAPSLRGSFGAAAASSEAFSSSVPSITARMSARISSGAEAPSYTGR